MDDIRGTQCCITCVWTCNQLRYSYASAYVLQSGSPTAAAPPTPRIYKMVSRPLTTINLPPINSIPTTTITIESFKTSIYRNTIDKMSLLEAPVNYSSGKPSGDKGGSGSGSGSSKPKPDPKPKPKPEEEQIPKPPRGQIVRSWGD